MAKKRAMNEQDKINLAKGKKFSKEYQPSPEKKREGQLKASKERKTMKEMLDYLLEKEITNNKGEKATTLEAIMIAAIKKAMSGDIKANEFIRDTIGQKPTDKQEITQREIKIEVANEEDKGLIEEL